MSSRAVVSENVKSPEISLESIRIEQAKDPIFQSILNWKRNGNKPDWSTIAQCNRERISRGDILVGTKLMIS